MNDNRKKEKKHFQSSTVKEFAMWNSQDQQLDTKFLSFEFYSVW